MTIESVTIISLELFKCILKWVTIESVTFISLELFKCILKWQLRVCRYEFSAL